MALAKDEDHNNGEKGPCSHFLVVAYGIQGHLNPARTLARRLASIGGCTVTLSLPISGHRRMFPSNENSHEEVSDGAISYIPFSDGKDDGSWPKDVEDRTQRREANFKSLSAVVKSLAASGQPVTCMVCTLSMPVVVQVAREHRLRLAVYWIQPATALATYYHYFHGHEELITQHATTPTYEVTLPGLHPLRIRDMPTFFTEKTHNEVSKMILQALHELFEQMDQEKPMVLVNTFDALEDAELKAIQPYVDVFVVGPAIPPLTALQRRNASEAQIHLFKQDEKNYMEWLNAQQEKSVVYLSFGSLITYTKRQVEEILHGLQSCRQPYLWVVRGEGRAEEADFHLGEANRGKGMVVEWCDQLQVLSHRSVRCFVTHCGWNSTLEAIASGVPMVAVPCWSDQPMNAHLVEQEWGVGVRAERDAEGVLTREELVSCLEFLMGDSEKAAQIRANANNLKERAQEAVAPDGPMERNLRRFIKRMQDLGSMHQENESVNIFNLIQ
ncbi:cyanidin 3-O-rutinoside 5-O-glucosyltransferase-like [Phragmites australis]|uniref:cyanidin 3-O-rutinoside 5-O-glucosyltransferase-like n=1 Tax=Phragmites australis TaxID=29695 RepID=UPI002D78F9A5|nr:cyanidin 3-O-rutinoside 5-O-glucosyltransferase-like [Phragmites australis]